MLSNFVDPYILMLYGGAWNFQQSLEGLRLSSSELKPDEIRQTAAALVSGWDPGASVLNIFLFMLIAAVILLILATTAGYVLSGWRGAIAILVIAGIPGALGIAGVWPNTLFISEIYSIGGDGLIGNGLSMFTLVFFCMILGWCISIIAIDMVGFRDNFWHIFDHIWIAAALLAGIFFAADSQINEHKNVLIESSRTTHQASSYLLKQISRYDQLCDQEDRKDLASCRWASYVQRTLWDYSTYPTELFIEFGPRSPFDLYSQPGLTLSNSDVEHIRTEIASYNQTACPIKSIGRGITQTTPPSSRCEPIPGIFCRAQPNLLRRGYDDISGTHALASECVIPTLISLRSEQEKFKKIVDNDMRIKYFRWAYYLIFSILIGGKISGSTEKLFKLSKRTSKDRFKSLEFFSAILNTSLKTIKFTLKTLMSICRLFCLFFIRICTSIGVFIRTIKPR